MATKRSWFLVAVYEIQSRSKSYSSITWNVLEYLALFLIVMLHEFGHALACRQVGGTANRIVLWPLGGVAYVNPPQRPGATLWSIAAGPLVNVAFLVILWSLGMLNRTTGWADAIPNAHPFLRTLWLINLGLLIFNLLPIYPLDGGQIAREILLKLHPREGIRASLCLSIVAAAAMAVTGFMQWNHDWLVALFFGYLAYASYITLQAYSGRNPW